MSRSPAHLTAAAVTVRALTSALTADFSGLGPHTSRATWEGPAASAQRQRTAAATRAAHEVAAELDHLAERLEAQAATVVEADAAAARRRAEQAAGDGPGERSDG